MSTIIEEFKFAQRLNPYCPCCKMEHDRTVGQKISFVNRVIINDLVKLIHNRVR